MGLDVVGMGWGWDGDGLGMGWGWGNQKQSKNQGADHFAKTKVQIKEIDENPRYRSN